MTHFIWYDVEILSIDRVIDKENFYGKKMQKMCTKRYDIETLSIDRVLDKENSYGKNMQKMCTKS